MRVLIVLALIGAACAVEYLVPGPAPLAYSSVYVDEPKPSYEYSTSVQAPNYNNYAHVRSGGNLERRIYNFAAPYAAQIATPIATPAVAAAEPILAETRVLQPATYAAPVLKAAPLSAELRAAEIAAPAIAIPSTKLLPLSYEAKPIYRFAAPAPAPAIVAAAPAAAQVLAIENKYFGEGKSQYHSQNELGEATYGHREPTQAHDAVQDAQGNKAGSFSYVAPDGRLLTTEYIADAAGYRVASNALPNAPNAPAIPAAIPAAITPAIAAVEKPLESGDSVVVEAKSRSRRAAVYTPIAPIAPIARTYPYTYTSYAYTPTTAYSSYSSSSYSSPYYSPYYRSYAYSSYPAYQSYPSYYSYAFRK